MAFILVSVKENDIVSIASEIMKIPEVKTTHIIYGEYDIIFEIETKTLIELRETTLNKIHKLPGVQKTKTFIVAEE